MGSLNEERLPYGCAQLEKAVTPLIELGHELEAADPQIGLTLHW